MNAAIEQAERMRQEAISLLIADRSAIDAQLAKLGFDGTTETKSQRQKVCSICQSADHNARTCPTKRGGAEVASAIPEA